MRKFIILFLLCASSVRGITLVQAVSGSTFALTLTSTGVGNLVVVEYDGSVTTAVVRLTGGSTETPPLQGTCLPGTNGNFVCTYAQVNNSGSHTSVTCTTTCGSVSSAHAYEYSGVKLSSALDHISVCTTAQSPASCVVTYTPGYSAEAIVTQWTCSGSASSFTATNITLNNQTFPGGEAGADGISSGFGAITVTVDTGCGANTSGIVAGFQGSSVTKQCSIDAEYFDYGTELGSSGNPTVTAFVNQVGDLVIAVPWAFNGASVTSVVSGSDTLTLALGGNSSATTGQGFIYYDLSATASGTQTITATITGTRTNSQVAYYDFTPSAGCTVAHDIDSSVGTGTGLTATTPSITPTTGDLLFNFTYTQTHATMTPSNSSPWVCNLYVNSGETGNCMFNTSVNVDAYVLSVSAGSTSNNVSKLNNDDWQAIITSFKLNSGSGPTTIPGQFPRIMK